MISAGAVLELLLDHLVSEVAQLRRDGVHRAELLLVGLDPARRRASGPTPRSAGGRAVLVAASANDGPPSLIAS